jgi:hypothetical protein
VATLFKFGDGLSVRFPAMPTVANQGPPQEQERHSNFFRKIQNPHNFDSPITIKIRIKPFRPFSHDLLNFLIRGFKFFRKIQDPHNFDGPITIEMGVRPFWPAHAIFCSARGTPSLELGYLVGNHTIQANTYYIQLDTRIPRQGGEILRYLGRT